MQLFPGMYEAILSEIIRKRMITRQFPKEIPDVRLMSANQFAESGSILAGYHPCDQLIICAIRQRPEPTNRDP